MSKDYTLLLKGQLDVSGIDKDIQNLQAKINKGLSGGTRNKANGLQIVDIKKDLASLDQIQKRIDDIKAKSQNLQVTTTMAGGDVTGKILKYRDALGSTTTETYKLAGATKEGANMFAQTSRNVEGSTRSISTWTDGLSNAISRTLQYATSIGLVYGALNQLRQGIEYIKDLNKEMTNIQLVSGASSEEIDSLSSGYNTLAKEMGATTLEIAKGSLEFVRQGKTAEETAILIRNSTMMSKLGNMEAAEATDKLTSIMNGFQFTAGETGAVIDKLVGLDNAYATSVDEIATAMKYGSNSARQAGIDFDHLAAYVTVVSSTTRQSAETIGQAFKTMTARFTDIKQGFDVGEGLDVNINNVEKALREVNIPIRDSANEFRDMQDVIYDLGKVWDDLSGVQQAQITKQFAGIRQKEMFLVLMNEQVKVEKALKIEQESTNLAEERYAIYMESVEAAQNKLTASWEKLVMSSDTGKIVSGWLNFASTVLDIINSLGGLPTILKIVTPLIILFNAALIQTKILAMVDMFAGLRMGLAALIPVFTGTTIAAEGSAAAFMAANVAALPFVATIALITGGLILGIKAINDYKKAQDEILTSLKDTGSGIKDTAKTYDEYIAKSNEAAVAAGYFYDENGKMFHEGYHGAKVYVNDMDLMTESMYEASKMTDRLYEANEPMGERLSENAQAAKDLATGYDNLAVALGVISDITEKTDKLLSDYMENGLSLSEAASLPPEYLDALYQEGDVLRINIDLIKQKELATVLASLNEMKAMQERGQATQAQVDIIQAAYDQLLGASQQTYGAFNQTAYGYQALLWQISNDAANAGYQFLDMEGKALSSAQNIFDYMSKGDAQFNAVVVQIAQQTGRSVAEVMNMINGMIAQTAGNLQSLGGMQRQYLGQGVYLPAMGSSSGGSVSSSNVRPSQLFSAPAPSYGGGGGGGGGGSNRAQERATREAERQRQIEEDIAKARKQALDNLNKQLKLYKDIVDKRKDYLDTLAEERSYQQENEEAQKNVLDLQNQIAELQLDTSPEAQAQLLGLQEDLLSAQQDLGNLEYEHSVQAQRDALDAELARQEQIINNMIGAVESINATSLAGFMSQLSAVLATNPSGRTGGRTGVPAFHSGLDMGVVGGSNRKGEQFAKLLKGEVVVNPDQMSKYMNQVLPSTMRGIPNGQSTLSSGMQVGNLMNITVAGNLDKTVLPSIQKIAEGVIKEINKGMGERGFSRRADAFSI